MSLEEKIEELRYLLDLNESPFDDIPDEFFTLVFPTEAINQDTKDFLIDHGVPDYQKLEWLGDSVLELIMRTYMFKYRRDLKLGDLNSIKQQFVSNQGLHELLAQYSICTLTDNHDVKQCADVLETIIGIIYYWLAYQGQDPILPLMNWFLDTFDIEDVITGLVDEKEIAAQERIVMEKYNIKSPKKSPRKRRSRRKRQKSP